MKRIFLSVLTILTIILVSCSSLDGYAQKGKVASALNYIDAGNLDKAKEAMDAAMVHHKTVDWPKTYYAMGRLAQAMWETEDAKKMSVYENQLIYAYDNYLKAIELDEKNTSEKLIIIQLPSLSNNFINWGAKAFGDRKFEESLLAFEKLLEIQASDIYLGSIDTLIVFNAGLAAYNAKIYDKAHKHFDWCIIAGYGETTPYFLKYQAYTDIEDPIEAEKCLIATFEAFPGNIQVIRTMIQFFIDNDKSDEALSYIDLALKDQPDDALLHYAKGVIFMGELNYTEAVKSLDISIELDTESFESNYNAGVCYYNMASDLFTEANEIMNATEYNTAVEEAMLILAKSLPYMEKAHEIKTDDYDTLVSLKELYFRMKMMDKYDVIIEKLKDMEG